MRIVLAAAGSRGDVQPMVALAHGLAGRGHEVVVAGPPGLAPVASEQGVAYRALGGDAPAVFPRAGRDARASVARQAVVDGFADHLRAQLDTLPGLVASAELVIGAGMMMLGARSVAEARGIPYVGVGFAPGLFSSRLSSMLFPAAITGALDTWRRGRGLEAVRHPIQHAFPVGGSLLAADPELLDAAPAGLRWSPTGAWELAGAPPLDPRVQAFVDGGEPPVYIGFGNMPGPRPGAVVAMAQEIASALGQRVILRVRGLQGGGAHDTAALCVVEEVSHRSLLPRTAAVVHHGGAGTTAAAARAGVPQVIVPHAFDQFYWARRMHALGVAAAPVARPGLSARSLLGALQQVLGQAQVTARAMALGARLRERDGVATAIAHLEALGA